ncbi:phage tail assembly chaperone family protein, TAC [Pantoea sp. 18069]|uniref:phage tail assembly chaperone family protein, TAC n=1 Tax=Pantoea sp. 18069 TaxID=2681415 RepID=UPI001359261D|nr:phage tail assembly chaperone family protein, TAC [Pantoea sp. 18069]
MNLHQLTEKGGFVEASPVKMPVTWTRQDASGKDLIDKFDVWVRRRSFGTFERVASLGEDRSRSAKMLSECVLLGDTQESLSYEQAYQLEPSLAMALIEAVKEASAPKA